MGLGESPDEKILVQVDDAGLFESTERYTHSGVTKVRSAFEHGVVKGLDCPGLLPILAEQLDEELFSVVGLLAQSLEGDLSAVLCAYRLSGG